MAFETNKFMVVKKKRLEKSTFSVECNVETSVEIDKILSVCQSAQADNVEILNGVANYAGHIDLCVLYMTVDGEIGTLNSSCPFTGKFEDDFICVGDRLGIKVDVADYAIDSFGNGNIKLSCVCEQSGILICGREVGCIATGDEDICMKEDEILVNTLVGQARETFAVESEISIKEPVKKVITSDSQVFVKSVESGVDFVSVGGEVVTKILYLTESDRFETGYTTESFKEEVELAGVTREAVSEAAACVRRSDVKCEVENSDKGVDVKISIPVELQVTSYLEKNQVVVKDLYSTANDLQVSTESFEMTRQMPCDLFEEKIDGTLTLDEDSPRVDKIMFVGGSNLVVTNAYVKGGEVFVEGVTKTNVVYLNDETSALYSVVVEVPFVVSDKTDCEDDAEISVDVVLTDVDVAVKKGREFLFDAKLKITVSKFCQVTGAVISGAQVAEPAPERDCGMELVFASAGQTAWDIAKAIRVREETVIFQNPDLVFPLEKDENVVVFFNMR